MTMRKGQRTRFAEEFRQASVEPLEPRVQKSASFFSGDEAVSPTSGRDGVYMPAAFVFSLAVPIWAGPLPPSSQPATQPSVGNVTDDVKRPVATTSPSLNSQGLSTNYVWFEVNSWSTVQTYLRNAPAWSHVGTNILTSSRPDIVKAIGAEIPIIPSLKTSAYITDLSSVNQWRQVAEIVRDISAELGTNVFVLENETAFRNTLHGAAVPNFAGIDAAIGAADWPADIEIWWYPSVVGENHEIINRYKTVAESAIRAIPSIRLVDTSTVSSERAQSYGWAREQQRVLQSLNVATVPVAYFGYTYWSLSDVSRIDLLVDGPIVFYPHFVNIDKGDWIIDFLDSSNNE